MKEARKLPWRLVPRRTRLIRLLSSVPYLAILSLFVSQFTGASFLFSIFVVLAIWCVTFGAGLFVGIRIATGTPGSRQITLGVVFAVTFLIALYLALARWVVTVSGDENSLPPSIWFTALVGVGLLAVFSLPPILMLGDSLLEFAVWVIHRPAVRGFVRGFIRRRRRSAERRIASGQAAVDDSKSDAV